MRPPASPPLDRSIPTEPSHPYGTARGRSVHYTRPCREERPFEHSHPKRMTHLEGRGGFLDGSPEMPYGLSSSQSIVQNRPGGPLARSAEGLGGAAAPPPDVSASYGRQNS